MAQNQSPTGFSDVLSENNYKSIQDEFLKYTDKENFVHEYEFSSETGLQLDWGKYDYSIPAEQQEPDMELLYKAIMKFNLEFIGRFVAFGEMGDKFNSVFILDLQQISSNKNFIEELQVNKDHKPYKTALDLIKQVSSDNNNQKKEKNNKAMIRLNWRLHKVLGVEYYYTFHNDRFWCIKADYIVDGTITETEFVFQVTTHKMEDRTKNAVIERLSNLFPELSLQQIKNALQYDKDASIQT